MARNRTLAEIRQECYDRTDVREAYISTAEMDRMINNSLADLYDLVVESSKDFYAEDDTISVTSGTDKYSLPSDFYRLLAVDVQDGSYWYALHRYNLSERNQLQAGGSDRRLTRYAVMGGQLRLRPTPTWSGTLRILYIPAPPILASDTDTWDGVAGWEEYVVTDVARKVAIKQEEDPSPHIAALKDLEARIRTMAQDIDDSEPQRVRDVYAEAIGTDVGGIW